MSAYLSYIANFIENVAGGTSKYEWRKYLARDSVLGEKLFTADEADIKKLARHLYRSYVLSHFSRHDAFLIASKLTDKQIEEYLEAEIALDKKYKLDYDTVSNDISQKASDAHIKKVEFTRYKSVLTKIDPKNSPTKIKADAAAARAKEKEGRAKAKEAKVKKAGGTTKPAAKKLATKSSTKSAVKSSSTKKSAAVKSTSTKPSATKKSTSIKPCKEHNLTELKEIAKERGLSGYSKLNKADLCKMLKIK